METKEINQENIKVLVKLGIDVEDIADLYVKITQKGHDISKEEYVNNLTEKLKFFQTRNNGIDEEKDKAIYKEDVLEMLKKNKKMIGIDIDKKIKPLCKKLDGYYFMTPSDTNELIKNNPNIFNVNKVDLEIFSAMFSCFAIKINDEVVNLFEYIIKQKSELLNYDVKEIYQRLCYIKQESNSNLITLEDVSNLLNVKFIYNNKEVLEKELKEKYELPVYKGQDISLYKEEVTKGLK